MVRKLLCLICFVFVAMLLMPANALAVSVVDTFNSYSTGLLNTVANPPWTEAFNKGAAAVTIAASGGAQYLRTAVTPLIDQTDAAWRGLPTPILNADTSTTMYLRFRTEEATANSSFGLTDMAVPVGYLNGSFGEYANQMRVSVQPKGGLAFDVRNGGIFTAYRIPINVGQWYNVWAVLNNSTDKYDVYFNTGGNAVEADKKFSVMGFRKTSLNDLVTMLVMTQGSATNTGIPLDIDDIYVTTGKDLATPEPATMVLLGLGSLALLKRRKS